MVDNSVVVVFVVDLICFPRSKIKSILALIDLTTTYFSLLDFLSFDKRFKDKNNVKVHRNPPERCLDRIRWHRPPHSKSWFVHRGRNPSAPVCVVIHSHFNANVTCLFLVFPSIKHFSPFGKLRSQKLFISWRKKERSSARARLFA